MDYSLYLVTAGFDYQEDAFLQVVEDAVKAGVTLVQFRGQNGNQPRCLRLSPKIESHH